MVVRTKKEKTLIPETREPCLEAGIQKFWNVGTFYSLNKADEKTKQRSRTCGGVVRDFLEQTGAKLVTDPVNGEPYDNASWAIRDRSCIEDITGTPEDLFQAVFLGKLNRHRTPIDLFGAGSIKPYNRPSATLLLMINIFGEAPGFLTADWNHVVRTFMTKTGFQYTDQLLPGFNEEPHSIRNAEFEVVGYHLLNYTAECAKKNRLVELQGLYKSYADWYFARNNKICGPRDLNDPVCRWGSVSAMAGNSSRPNLTDWDHISSVLSLLKDVKDLCVSSQ